MGSIEVGLSDFSYVTAASLRGPEHGMGGLNRYGPTDSCVNAWPTGSGTIRSWSCWNNNSMVGGRVLLWAGFVEVYISRMESSLLLAACRS